MADFQVVIIGAPDSQRLQYFKTSIEIMEALDPFFLDATMLDSNAAEKLVSQKSVEYQKVLYGRKLLNPEMGCAMSHRSAQKLIAETPIGGLILEDDARINDLTSLTAITEKFLIENKDESAILSFFDGRTWSTISSSFRIKHPYVRVWGSTAYAVSYAITPKAARALSIANQDYRYGPDWPATNCQYFTSTHNLVSHGDSSTMSTIDPDGSQRPAGYSWRRRILVLSGLYYFTHWKTFGRFKNFLSDLWIPRLNFYVTKINFKYLALRYRVK